MIVTIGGTEMPCQFKYKPLIPKKRIFYKETAGGLVAQRSSVPIIQVGQIPFTLNPADSTSFQRLCKLYSDDESVVFTGYWGEEYLVDIVELTPTVTGGYMSLEGILQVVCTVQPYCLNLNC